MKFRQTAVRRALNIFGKPVRRRILIRDVLKLGLDYDREELLDLLDRGHLLPMLGGALQGATTSKNTVMANPIYFPKAIAVTTDQTINQGDLVRWDGVNFTLKQLTDPTQVPYIVGGNYGLAGVAQGQSNPNVYPAPQAGTPAENLPGVIVQRGGTVKLATTVGDGNLFDFEPVTVGADAQTITRGGVTTANRVGLVISQLPATARGAAGSTPAFDTVSSGTGLFAEIWIEPKFPGTYLL